MSNVIPFPQPPHHPRKAVAAAKENQHPIHELRAVLDELREAIKPAVAGSARAQSKIEEAMRLREAEEAAQRILQNSFQSALAQVDLADLEAARDAYIDLMARHRAKRGE
ncbi:MAG: hypothetical protein IT565_09785 [Rhodospirillales bacterium]|nr:hypothetical protein [Rhodospirillales bacterium]